MARKKAAPKPRYRKPRKVSVTKLRASGQSVEGKATSSTGPAGHVMAGPTHGAAAARDLDGTAGAGAGGLGSFILDLAGEGRIGLGHALSAWQREQDRIVNRAWRRPGGLQRMGGL